MSCPPASSRNYTPSYWPTRTPLRARNTFGRRVQMPLTKGEYKKRPNSPIRADGLLHEYCPPEQVALQMERLVEMHASHVRQGTPPEVEAAWLHHRFVQIHPFQDGNGRVARALATLVMIREGLLTLVVTDAMRGDYIGALEAADNGDLGPLVRLFGGHPAKSDLRGDRDGTEYYRGEAASEGRSAVGGG